MTQQIETTELVTGTWSIDPSHSEVGFSVRHLMSKVKGTFADFSGTITTTSANPVDSSVEVTIVSSSISTNNAQRDGHLQVGRLLRPDQRRLRSPSSAPASARALTATSSAAT